MRSIGHRNKETFPVPLSYFHATTGPVVTVKPALRGRANMETTESDRNENIHL